MGLRSFLKKTVRFLGIHTLSSPSAAQREAHDDLALDRIEAQIADAATNRERLKLLNLWHQLSLWQAPPPKVAALKQRLAQLFQEFEGQRVNPNASPSTLLVLVSQIASRHADQPQQADQERVDREEDARCAAAEAERQKQEHERVAEAERLACEAAARRQAEIQQLKDEWARQQAEVEQLRQEQVRLAKEEAARLAEEAEAERLHPELEQQSSDVDLEPLAEDVVLVQNLRQDPPPIHDQRTTNPDWLNKPIQDLSLPTRVANSLYYGGITTVADLAGKQAEDLLAIRNLGKKSLHELVRELERHGIPFPVPARPG